VTAGIQIKDEAGNPVSSGSSDSGLFEGVSQSAAEATEATDTQKTGVECGTHYANDPTKNTSGAKECFDISFQTCTPATYTKVSTSNGKETQYTYEVVEKATGVCKVK